jgi:alpha-glucosidase
LATSLIAPNVIAAVPPREHQVSSPDGKVQFSLVGARDLNFEITLNGNPLINTSRLGISVDGVDLGEGASVVRSTAYRLRERYVWRGVHSLAINNCNGVRFSILHAASKTAYTLDVRAFNDGIAFRLVVPGEGKERVPDEACTFKVPAGSTVWFHDFEGHYEGIHAKKQLADVKDGQWAAPPLTFKLPAGAGYGSITEAALFNYAGMGFQADGQKGFKARLGHAHPPNYPFVLRYKEDEAKRLSQPAAVSGTITTPWRVVMAGINLDALVNCDIVNNVSPPPDKSIFANGIETDWLRPGRAVWKYLDGGENNLETMKEFSRLAGELGFEHNIVEGFWRNWKETEMRELVDYAKQFRVGTWFWKHSRDLRTPVARKEFFALCQRVGVVGAKIDFLDHEAKEIIDHYQALLRAAAEHKVMVNFHGANKPAGEARTWPNEMTREGVRGLEYRRNENPARHNTTLPFTRYLAGHADYTPVHFGERRRDTSWAHQIATAVVFTSPLMIYGAHPKNILANPAVEMIKSIPSVWDETRVLPVSEIGEVAAFARRSGKRWFVGVLNGPEARTIKVPLLFLGNGNYRGMLVRDEAAEAAAVKIEDSVKTARTEALTIEMRAGGGFVGRFEPATSVSTLGGGQYHPR